MKVTLSVVPIEEVAALAGVAIAFRVERVCEVSSGNDATGGFVLTERPIATPYFKDYDAVPDEGPRHWARHFDLTHWGYIRAEADRELVGGAVLAFRTPGVAMLEGRDDLAVLWDIRVAPSARGQGIGAALFKAAETWAAARGCTELKVETQNINAPACRFYARCGCAIRVVNRHAYAEFPDEIQLQWSKRLSPG